MNTMTVEDREHGTPCDLCGGLHLTAIRTPGGRCARQCAECGLVEVQGEPTEATALPDRLLLHLLRPHLREAGRSLLILGEGADAVASAARHRGLRVSVLPVEAVGKRLPGEVVEAFDLVVIAVDLHALHSPAEAFETARRALRPGGELLLASVAADSVAARLRPAAWEERWIGAGHAYLIAGEYLRRYAHRHAFAVRTVRSYGGPLSPFGLGTWVTAGFTRVHATVRVRQQLRSADLEHAVGLAPAMRTTVERESMP